MRQNTKNPTTLNHPTGRMRTLRPSSARAAGKCAPIATCAIPLQHLNESDIQYSAVRHDRRYHRPIALSSGFGFFGRVGEVEGRALVLRILRTGAGEGRTAARLLVGRFRLLVVPPLTDQHAVVEHDLAFGAGGHQSIMRDDDDRRALAMQLAKEIEHDALVGLVKVAGRLVGQNQLGMIDERARCIRAAARRPTTRRANDVRGP